MGKMERDRRTERAREMCFDKSCRWLPFEMDGIVTLICLWVCVRMFMGVGLCGWVSMCVCVCEIGCLWCSNQTGEEEKCLGFHLPWVVFSTTSIHLAFQYFWWMCSFFLIWLIWFDYLFLFPFSCFLLVCFFIFSRFTDFFLRNLDVVSLLCINVCVCGRFICDVEMWCKVCLFVYFLVLFEIFGLCIFFGYKFDFWECLYYI